MRATRLAVLATMLVASVGFADSAPAASEPPVSAAVTKAKTHVAARFSVGGLYSVRGRRSSRDASWAVVTGYFRRPRARPNWWAVYLRARGGSWKVVWSGKGFAAAEPRVRAPCDIWPPLSEPSC